MTGGITGQNPGFDQIPKITNTEALVMEILMNKTSEEVYGWELMEESGGKLKKGTIYVILNRMEDKGLISSRKEQRREGARGLPRRMYKLTGLGHRTLSVWQMMKQHFVGGLYEA